MNKLIVTALIYGALTTSTLAGCFYRTTTGDLKLLANTPTYRDAEHVAQGWVQITREQALAIQAIPQRLRSWGGGQVVEKAPEVQVADTEAEQAVRVGQLLVDYRGSVATYQWASTRFGATPTAKQTKILAAIDAVIQRYRTALAGLGLSVP